MIMCIRSNVFLSAVIRCATIAHTAIAAKTHY